MVKKKAKTLVDLAVEQAIRDEEKASEEWLKENERRGKDPEIIKVNERFIRFMER